MDRKIIVLEWEEGRFVCRVQRFPKGLFVFIRPVTNDGRYPPIEGSINDFFDNYDDVNWPTIGVVSLDKLLNNWTKCFSDNPLQYSVDSEDFCYFDKENKLWVCGAIVIWRYGIISVEFDTSQKYLFFAGSIDPTGNSPAMILKVDLTKESTESWLSQLAAVQKQLST
jgi:hypothetical protein